jgi:hypothetical protein
MLHWSEEEIKEFLSFLIVYKKRQGAEDKMH